MLGNTGSLAKSGCHFEGCNTSVDGTGTSYAGGASFTIGSADVTLYAQWPETAVLTATITAPGDGDIYTYGDTIAFTGEGNDAEDGSLSGNFLVWTSGIDGEIGTGTAFSLDDLSWGNHTITLTVRDGEGATGTDSIAVSSKSWTHPSGLTDHPSPDGQDAEYQQVAMDDNGNAIITWWQSDGGNWQIFKSEYR